MDFWIIAAYLLATLALGLFAGAGVGYYAAARDLSDAPRYRRNSPEAWKAVRPDGLYMLTSSREQAEAWVAASGGTVSPYPRPE